MVRQHHPPNGPESEQTLGDSKGQGSLACCSLWGHKESDTVSDQTTTTNRKPLGFLSEFFSLSWRWLPGAFNLSDIICFGHTVVRGWQPQNLWCQILKKKKNSVNANAQASQRWWTWSSLFLRRNDQDARPASNDISLCGQSAAQSLNRSCG